MKHTFSCFVYYLKHLDVDETCFMLEYDRAVTKGMARLALEPDQSFVLGREKRRVTTCLQVFPKTIKICFKSNKRFKMGKKTIYSIWHHSGHTIHISA